MADYIPEESKKQPLFEIFRAAVWADLIGGEDLEAAHQAAVNAGVTEKDLEAVSGWDAKQCKDYFGEAAINRDLVNAMKAVDSLRDGMGRAFGYGGGDGFKRLGFY